MKFLLASSNQHKRDEYGKILKSHSVDIPSIFSALEDGTTYRENARKKLDVLLANASGASADVFFADDSGFEIAALDGKPGLYSARFLEGKSQTEKNLCILDMLKNSTDRSARFVCSIAFCSKNSEVRYAEGSIEGRVAFIQSGKGGFGYDPIFIPEGEELSFAELGNDFKNSCSHRAVAALKMLEMLKGKSEKLRIKNTEFSFHIKNRQKSSIYDNKSVILVTSC